ncbi:MAG: hypothetical protein PHP74_02685 [Candidatus Gracilibacteria bacterium]|nr:hypothetical protein [Candidatus Gracilibacteria bacterium]
MEVSYNLRYQKSNFSNKVILDKEGEIVIYGKGFRLKGKGGGDKGELINFSELKEFYSRDEKVIFITFNKEKYILSDCGNLFDQMLIDLYKARNEFLMDALFMKGGKLKAEFEGHFERFSKFNKLINKGHAKVRLFEKSLVIVPEIQDAFAVNFDFVTFYEFDELDYFLKVVTDDGNTLHISQLGNDYEFFQEKMDMSLGGMYEKIVNEGLKIAFQEFHAGVLLKIAYKMKNGKAASLKEIKKIDKDLATKVEEFIFDNSNLKELADSFMPKDDSYILFGITRDETVKGSFIRWVIFVMPEKNLVGFSILPRWVEGGKSAEGQGRPCEMFFYKIIMEQGIPSEKYEDKIRELNQSLLVLNFAKDPCYKDKRELKHSPYQYAIRKLPYLRILRKSFVGKIMANNAPDFQKQAEELFAKAKLQ